MVLSGGAFGAMFAGLCLVLAGCASAPAEDAASQEFEGISYEADMGTLRGVVVDPSIIPIPGAHIIVQGPNLELTTNDQGAFVATGLDAGVYILDVTKVGYFPVTLTAFVDPGADDVPTLKVILDRNEGEIPFANTLTSSGLLECGVGLGAASWSLCQVPIAAQELTCDASGVCPGPLNSHRGQIEFDIDGVPTFTQGEGIWDPTQPAAEMLTLDGATRHPDTIEFNNGTTVTGPSPIIIHWDAQANIDNQIGAEQDLIFQIFPSRDAGSLVLDQPFDLFLTTFYNFAPPEGWTFVEHGAAQVPR